MSLLSLSEVKKFYGRQDVLKDGGFAVNAGELVGLIGANGAGKSTILKLILGEESPDEGTITRAKGLRIGHLPQDLLNYSGQVLLGLVVGVAAELKEIEAGLEEIAQAIEDVSQNESNNQEKLLELTDRQGRLLERFDSLGGYTLESEAKKILTGLGFEEKDFNRPIDEFSGGWIMRAVLARLLLSQPDILLLDEPTNHLDLDSLLWLEDYLKACPSALILVSHDRVFLNNVIKKVIEVDRARVITYNGNYDRYLEEKEKRQATEAASFASQQERIKQVERFIVRNRVRKDRAKQVQSRMKMLEKMERIEPPPAPGKRVFKFHLPVAARSPENLVELSGVTKAYGNNTIYRDLNLSIRRGDRIAFLGPNGRGKSTLLKLLAGRTEFQAGIRRMGEGVAASYFAQFQLEDLTPHLSVLEELDKAAGDMSPGRMRSVLGGFLFRGDDVFKKVSVLSGGEKTRLILAKIMLAAPNLLLLDEPSNHLDIPGREMLEAALNNYTGALCLISHDRGLINAVANKILTIENGKIEIFPGNFDDYQEVWSERLQDRPAPKLPPAQKENKNQKTIGRAEREKEKKNEAVKRQRLHSLRAPLLKEIEGLEARIGDLSAELDRVAKTLADPQTYNDQELTKTLNLDHARLKIELDRASTAWEEAALELEDIGEGG